MSTQPMIEEREKVAIKLLKTIAMLPSVSTFERATQIKNALMQAYTLGTQDAIEDVEKEIIELAEPYDGAKWHNNVTVEQIKKILTSLKTSLTEQEK